MNLINIKDFSKESFLEVVWDLKEKGLITFPFESPSRNMAIKSFNELKNFNSCFLIQEGEWESRYTYKYPKLPLYIGFSLKGSPASNFFFFNERMNCDSRNSPSPYKTWNNKRYFKKIISALYSLKLEEINKRNLKLAINARSHVPSQFRPSAAKAIYDLFKPQATLDFSFGWGDRLIGFLSSDYGKNYIGVDPNTNLIPCYENMISLFNFKKTQLIANGAESIVSYPYKFDLVFTSPPYFNIEYYSKQETQSYKKFKTLNSWLNNFLFRSIDIAWNSMSKKGILAINISDVYSCRRVNKICDPMNDYIKSLPGSNYLGCLGYRMHKKLNNTSKIEGVFCEPIWIWSNYKCNFYDFT